MERGPRMVDQPRPQRDTAADDNGAGLLPRKSDGTDGARPKNGTHSRRKYVLLTSEEP